MEYVIKWSVKYEFQVKKPHSYCFETEMNCGKHNEITITEDTEITLKYNNK